MATSEASGSDPKRNRADTIIAVDKGKEKEQPEEENKVTYLRSVDFGPSAIQQLPVHLQLKGAENYIAWKRNVMDLLITNHLDNHVIDDPTNPKPKEITAENAMTATTAERLDWKDWRTGEARARLLLKGNILQSPIALINHLSRPKDMWELFETTYEGTLIPIAVGEWMDMAIEDFKTLGDFIIAYRKSIRELKSLGIVVPAVIIDNVFLLKVKKKFTIWGEHHRSSMLARIKQ
jgi:hypothetical protein